MKRRYDLAIAALAGAAVVLAVQALQTRTIRDANYCRRFADEVIANRISVSADHDSHQESIEDVARALNLPMRNYLEQACLNPPRNFEGIF
jgi:HPt (histidine-containing phosphotransfer) domain-containing protein